MKRVVISGIGIVSCLGNDKAAVLDSLQQGRSGIKFKQEYADIGMRSHVAGSVEIDTAALIDRKVKRFMGDAAAFAYIAMQQAIDDAKLDDSQVSNIRTGIVMGSGGASSANQVEAADILRRKRHPPRSARTWCRAPSASTVSACLATPFHIKGVNTPSAPPAPPAHTASATLTSLSRWANRTSFSPAVAKKNTGR